MTDAADRAPAPVAAVPVAAPQPATVVHSQSAPQAVAGAVPLRIPAAPARLTVAAARQAPPRRPAPVTAAPRVPVLEQAPAPVRRISLLQVVCWQIALVTILLTVGRPWPLLLAGFAAAAALLLLTAVRTEDRWLYQHAAPVAGFLCRTRRRDLPADAPVPALLDLLLPGCTVRTGGDTMMVSHRGGLTAVLHRPGDGVPAPGALMSLLDGHGPLGVQVVLHSGVRRDGPTHVWFAVHGVRGTDTPGDEELALLLRNAVRRLHRIGVPTEPVAGEALIAGLAHVTGGRREVREEWRHWQTGDVRQVTYLLAQPGERVLAAVLGLPVAVTVSLGSRAGTPTHAVLRLAATGEAALSAAEAELTTAGVRLTRLDGRHARGVAASLPIGVFLP